MSSDAVGGLDDVQVVLDDQHRVARVHQALQHLDELADVVDVQAGGRLVQDVEGLARLLALAARSASFTRCASPPESVVAGWPRRM